MAERDLKRLAACVVAARERLGLTQEEFAARCVLGLKTIQRVELARVEPRAKTYNGLDQGAGWEPGSARAIHLEGREPIELGAAAPPKERSAEDRTWMRTMSEEEFLKYIDFVRAQRGAEEAYDAAVEVIEERKRGAAVRKASTVERHDTV